MKKRTWYHVKHPVIVVVYFSLVIFMLMFSTNIWVRILILLFGAIINSVIFGMSHSCRLIPVFMSIILFSSLSNILFVHYGRTILFEWMTYRFTLESFLYGLSFGVMISAMVIWFQLFSNVMDSEKLQVLLKPVSPKLSLVLAMSLRLIPSLQVEMVQVKEAQQGLIHESGCRGKWRLASRVWLSVLGRALEGGMITANSMIARGYHLSHKSRYEQYTWTLKETLHITVLILLGLALFYFQHKEAFAYYYYPRLKALPIPLLTHYGYVVLVGLLSLPLFYEGKERCQWYYSTLKK